MPGSEILCVGELLWDALPAGLFLGGAPFNVACHLRAAGHPVAMATRVGTDHLGDEARRRAALFGIATDLIQRDEQRPTGLVRVTLDEQGEPCFEIASPAAWDAIAPEDELLRRAESARALVFGTLAQRDARSRGTIERLWDSDALKVYDVNLRSPHDDPAIVARSLHRADVVKLAEWELTRLATPLGLADGKGSGASLMQSAAALSERYSVPTVCVTRGKHGAAMWRDGVWTEHPGFDVEVVDTVGAGDAFVAVMLSGLLAGGEPRAILEHANMIGAYVVTQRGAVPPDQPLAAPPATARAASTSPGAPSRAPRGGRRRP